MNRWLIVYLVVGILLVSIAIATGVPFADHLGPIILNYWR